MNGDIDAAYASGTQTPILGSPTGSLKGKQGGEYYEYMDMTLEEQQEWEEREMANQVDFLNCHIDPAPFQLVEKSSLLKVRYQLSSIIICLNDYSFYYPCFPCNEN